jgi:hypothetical protein
MTYERGQQVLVRGVVRNIEDAFVEIQIHDRDPRALEDWVITVAAVDVVGPAPATPDEGADLRHRLQSHDRDCCPCVPQFRAELWKTTAALAAAEAKRDALNVARERLARECEMQRGEIAARDEAIRTALDLHGQFEDRCVTCYAPDPCRTRRALSRGGARRAPSVEAAGPEGGGGHE